VQECGSKLVFQPAYGMTQRRGRKTKLARRAPEASLFGNDREGQQIGKILASH